MRSMFLYLTFVLGSLRLTCRSRSDFQLCALRIFREFFKHAIHDSLVRGTELSSLRLSNKENDNSLHNNRSLA